MKYYIIKNIKGISITVWIFLAILLIGIFLRTYQFHNWLTFGSDQVQDAKRVENVVEGKRPWPLLGPDMSKSSNVGKGHAGRFHLGPIYYYFEIISAEIFGNKPDSMAYPDMLFGILSLPLFFIFFKRYFSEYISLALMGLYAISYYSLSFFSHSALNVNSVPFFVLLFLLSLYEILIEKKILWRWVIFLGIALGVGIQLHAILLVLLPAVVFFSFLYSLKQNWKVLSKWSVVFLIAIVLNFGQIIHEQKTNFANSKIFLNSVTDRVDGGNSRLLKNFEKDVTCHMESNAFMLSSIEVDCHLFDYMSSLYKKASPKTIKNVVNPVFLMEMLFDLLLSVSGYTLLVVYFRREKEKRKKCFLGLLILYVLLSFLVMLPVFSTSFNIRYFVHTFFVPYLLLGFIIVYLRQRFPDKYLAISLLIFLFVAVANIISIQSMVARLMANSRSKENSNNIVQGEMESIASYIISQSNSQKQIYLIVGRHFSVFYKALSYIANQRNVEFERISHLSDASPGKSVFEISRRVKNNADADIKYPVIYYKNFGQAAVFKLNNQSSSQK